MNRMSAIAYNPPHGGFPTPSYDDAPMRRRLTSLRIFGHSGASVAPAVDADLRAAGGLSLPSPIEVDTPVTSV